MEQTNPFRIGFGRVICRAIGICVVLLFLLWNPIVLQPRFWDASVVVRSIAVDATLLVVGVGLFCLRRWAALLCIALSVCFAHGLGAPADPAGILLTVILLIPLPVAFVFWQILTWGNKKRDPLIAIAGVMVSAIVHYGAFLMHVHGTR
jgi:hypothetical protein